MRRLRMLNQRRSASRIGHGGDPAGPAFGLGGGPGLQVQVESADGEERCLDVGPGLAVLADEQPLLPCLDLLFGEVEVNLVRADLLDDLPEVLDQAADEVLRRGVVHLGGAAPEVLDQQVPDLAVAQLVAVDQVFDRRGAR